MTGIQVSIRLPNGQKESSSFDAEELLIGSAAHCDVRLPMEESAPEHLRVLWRDGAFQGELRSDRALVTIDGSPFTGGTFQNGVSLGIGGVRLALSAGLSSEDKLSASQSAKGEMTLPKVLALVAIVSVLGYLVLSDSAPRIGSPPAAAPGLFASEEPRCPQPDPVQAVAFAEEQTDLAETKRERMPFVVRDGVEAVRAYETASACLRAAGKVDVAERIEREARSLKNQLLDEFRARRLRLSHALQVEDYKLAHTDVGVLRVLVGEQAGAYSKWLQDVSEQLKSKEVE